MEKVSQARDSSIVDRQIYGLDGTVQNVARSVATAVSNLAVSGTAGYAAIFSTANAIGASSHVFEDGTGVGIGTTSPAVLLHVYGSALVCGFALDSGATAGHILTATDSSGNAVWSAPSAAVDGSGTANYVPKWSDSDTLTDSLIRDTGNYVTVNGTPAGNGTIEIYSTGTRHAVYGIYTGASTDYSGGEFRTSTSGAIGLRAIYTGAGASGSALFADGNSGYGIVVEGETAAWIQSTGTGQSLYVNRNINTNTTAVVEIDQESTANDGTALHVTQAGIGRGLYVERDNGSATSPLAYLFQDNASDSERVLEVRGDGTGDLLYLTNGASYRFYVTDSGQSYFNTNGDGDALTIYTNNTDATKGSLRLEVDGSYGANYFDTCSGGHANHAPQVIFRRGRGTVSSPSTTQSGDQLGGFYFRGHNGTDYQQRAGFASFLDGAVSGSTVPANLIFYTGTTALSERMRLSSAGDLGLGVTSPGAKADLQASNATHALRVNQQSTGNIATFQDNAVTAVEILDGGNLYAQKGTRVAIRSVSTSPTTLAATDEVIFVATSAVTHTITLPAVAAGRKIKIKDSDGNAATRNITVNRGGTSLIDGATSQTINTNYGVLDLVSDGTDWFIMD